MPIKATRLLSLPPYLFEQLENSYRTAVAAGRDVVDLSIGDPDLAPPASLIDRLEEAVRSGCHHQYPPQRGRLELKAAIRNYLSRRAGVNPSDDQILILVGSKEGIAHLPWAVCDPGDVVLLPDPGYPVYNSAAGFAGCRPATLPLDATRGFLPDFDALGARMLENARLCFLNYPNNPTSATGDRGTFQRALSLARDHQVIVSNDAAYADVYYDGRPPELLCASPGALETPIVEFFSFSKTYCITGWRIGFAVGRADVIEALAHMKANIDSGVFGAIQEAIALTLETDGDDFADSMRREFQARRDLATTQLERLGFQSHPTCATFYVWARVPDSRSSMDFAMDVLEKANVLVTPGSGFGTGGEGYFRIALTRSLADLEAAFDRMAGM